MGLGEELLSLEVPAALLAWVRPLPLGCCAGDASSAVAKQALSLSCVLQVGQTYQPDRLAAHLGAVLSAAGLGGSAGNGNSSASSNSGSGGGFGPEAGSRSPWAWDVSGELLACLAGQALFYGAVVLLIETGVLPRLWRRARAAWRAQGSRQGAGYQRLPGTEQEAAAAGAGAGAAHTAEDGQAEDVDVAAERRAVQSGRLPAASVAVLLQGVSKTYWQPAGRSARRRQGPAGEPAAGSGAGGGRGGPVLAVRDLWLGIGRHEPRLAWEQRGSAGASSGGGGAGGEGECFGLLGVNGAGKTTTWRMVTGGGGAPVVDWPTLATGAGLRLFCCPWQFLHDASAAPPLDPSLPKPAFLAGPRTARPQARSHLTAATRWCAAARCCSAPPLRGSCWATARRPGGAGTRGTNAGV